MAWTHRSFVLKRDELYAEVWSNPATKVAAKYGISGPALAKICRKLNLPLPPRGYWARKAAGKKVHQTPLPRTHDGDPIEHRIYMRENSLDTSPRSAAVEEAIQREQTPEARIAVTTELLELEPHPLVAKSLATLTKAGLKAKEVLVQRRCLDVVVSREHVPRALRIMDALLKAFDRRGFKVEVTAPVPPPEGKYVPTYERHRYKPALTGVHVGDAFIEFRIEEQLETVHTPEPTAPRFKNEVDRVRWQIAHPRPAYEQRSTGRLVLRLCSFAFLNPPRQTWRDGKHHRLEEMLNEFVVGVLDLAERHRLWQEELERLNQERRENERRRAEEERRHRLEERRVADLERRIAALQAAGDIDALVQVVEAGGTQTETDDVHAWLVWARARAERLRASAVAQPVLLQDVTAGK